MDFNPEMGLQSRFDLKLHDKPYINSQCHSRHGAKAPSPLAYWH